MCPLLTLSHAPHLIYGCDDGGCISFTCKCQSITFTQCAPFGFPTIHTAVTTTTDQVFSDWSQWLPPRLSVAHRKIQPTIDDVPLEHWTPAHTTPKWAQSAKLPWEKINHPGSISGDTRAPHPMQIMKVGSLKCWSYAGTPLLFQTWEIAPSTDGHTYSQH